jgi:hypothetical protein
MTNLQQKVFRGKGKIGTATMFEYGNLYRVKYSITDRDPNKTHTLAEWDREYLDEQDAQKKYDSACADAKEVVEKDKIISQATTRREMNEAALQGANPRQIAHDYTYLTELEYKAARSRAGTQ